MGVQCSSLKSILCALFQQTNISALQISGLGQILAQGLAQGLAEICTPMSPGHEESEGDPQSKHPICSNVVVEG